jgi:hypothetical protein
MTLRLYLLPLPEADADTENDTIGAQIAQSGLLEQGGLAVEPIATENVDLRIQGRFTAGERLNRKLIDEAESLGEGSYTALPLYNTDADPDRKRSYYEVSNVDINASAIQEHITEYTVELTHSGTRNSHWRAIETAGDDADNSIGTGLATGSPGQIGIPAGASNVRWFDPASGTEAATRQTTRSAEFGDVAIYDPTEPTFDNPTLIYGLEFAEEGPVDVRVWDDRGGEKFLTGGTDSGVQYDSLQYDSATVTDATLSDYVQWIHAYDAGFEFDGRPLIDNGLLRVRFEESLGTLSASTWSGSAWTGVTIDQGDYELRDADLERVGPALVDVFTRWEDTTDGSSAEAILSLQRGNPDVVVRETDNGTLPAGLESVFDPIASDQTTDPRPSQTIRSREEVK